MRILLFSRDEMFPDEDTPNKLFNNIPFSQIPICNIKISKNNTIISITDARTGMFCCWFLVSFYNENIVYSMYFLIYFRSCKIVPIMRCRRF